MSDTSAYFPCRPVDDDVANRMTLQWISEQSQSRSLRATLKHDVTGFTVAELPGPHDDPLNIPCTFTLHASNAAAAESLKRHLPQFQSALIAGYLWQCGIVLEEVAVTL